MLLHGLASQRRFWDPVARRLAGLPLVALDQRGHGESDRPADGYDVPTFVRDVTVALDALGVSRAVLVGHSWGATLALSVAAARPERVLAVVAVEGGLTSPSARWTRDEARAALAPPDFAVPPTELRSMLRGGPLAPWWRPEVEEALLPLFEVGSDGLARARVPRDQHLALIDAMWDYDPASVLPEIRVPCWVVSAVPVRPTDDERARQWADDKRAGRELATELLFRPRLVEVVGGVHDVPLQWPALIAGVVRAAIEELGSASGSQSERL